MNSQTRFGTDLTVRSFAYVAKQLAESPVNSALSYERILSEAEKHRSALRMVQGDVFERAEQALRKKTMTKTEYLQLRETAAQTVSQAQQAITRIATRYAPLQHAA